MADNQTEIQQENAEEQEKIKSNKSEESKKKSSKSERIKELEKNTQELKDKYLRLFADFDNYKKRTAKEKLQLIQTASRDVITDLLPVLDDFERAAKNASPETDVNTVNEGMELIYNKFTNILKNKGLAAMESIGKKFDSEMHEAITEIEAPKKDLKGKVIDEVEKGYYLNDTIIRFAKVIVGK